MSDQAVVVLGALLGTQNGRDVEIVNSFELAIEDDGVTVDQGFLVTRKEQCWLHLAVRFATNNNTILLDKQVFPSLEFIGWYTVAERPTARHIALHEQVCYSRAQQDPRLMPCKFTPYSSTPLLLIMQPSTLYAAASDVSGQSLPLKAFEPTIEIRDRKSRSVFIEAPFSVETGEAERIAVDWTAKGGSSGTSRE